MNEPAICLPTVTHVLYTQPVCPGCIQLKARLQTEGTAYVEMQIGKDISLEDFQSQYPGVRSVPHLVHLG